MRKSFVIAGTLLILLIFVSVPVAGQSDIISDVRAAISAGSFPQADALLQRYKAQRGVTLDWLEALSWMARGELAARQLDKAEQYAKQTHQLSLGELKKRPLDAEPHLPIALGAAIEVQAQVSAARDERSQAEEFLKRQLALYRSTSIATRLEKNLNLLSLEGKPAPALDVAHYLGSKPQPLAALRGKPVLLYFWAHWCMDCRAEAPLLARVKSAYAGQGLTLVGPTQLYGYAARGEDASPQQELAYIDEVRKRHYAGLSDVPVPVSQRNFTVYGASTTPTLVLLDRRGIVRLYHPGALGYADLKAAVDKVVAQ
jgi:thiol-disulfide isomerase/thioredoxin